MYRDNDAASQISLWAAGSASVMSDEDVIEREATAQYRKLRSSGDVQTGRPSGDQKKIQGTGDSAYDRLVIDV